MEIIDEKKVKGIRAYFMEYVVLALVVSVCTLFALYKNLNDFMTHEFLQNNARMEIVIERNTDVINSLKK